MFVTISVDGLDREGRAVSTLVAAGISSDDIFPDRRGTTGAIEVEVDRATADVVSDLAQRCATAGVEILDIQCT